MKRNIPVLILITLLAFTWVTSGIGLGAGTMELKKAYKTLKKENGKAFIIGGFRMIHTKLDQFHGQSPDIEDINSITQCYLTVALEDLSGKKSYNFEFKPVAGSIYDNPYPKKMLEENDNDPYWVLEVSPGTYELTTVTFRINIDKEGYQFFDKDISTTPIERYIKRTVQVTAAPKRIVYIGDYLADFRTNVLLLNKKQLYPFNQLNISLTDNFKAAKEAIMSKADEESKEKLESYEMIGDIGN